MSADNLASASSRQSGNFVGGDLSSQKSEGNDPVKEFLRTLIYKRTHKGDPDDSGIFGISDCMGRVRRWSFDAVIGVGGKRPDPGHEHIGRKVNWVGIGSHEVGRTVRGPRLAFDQFRRFDEIGPDLKKLTPRLFRYMFEDRHVRAVLSQNLVDKEMQTEVQRILRWFEETEHIQEPLPIVKRNRSTKCGC
jgi:hypothetical protein